MKVEQISAKPDDRSDNVENYKKWYKIQLKISMRPNNP